MSNFKYLEHCRIYYKIKNIEVYPPSEDSFLLAKYSRILSKGIVLDMGCGSGIQGIAASYNKKVNKMFFVDIDKDALFITSYNLFINNIIKPSFLLRSNLFKALPKDIKFDTILFNPPYLPLEGKEDYKLKLWTVAGKKGNEIILKFLKNAKYFLSDNGKIILLISSLSNKKKIDRYLIKKGYKYKILEELPLFFEKLYIYYITLKS